MKKIRIWEWNELAFDNDFPYDASEELLKNTLFAAEAWDGEDDAVVSYWDIKTWFDGWDQEDDDEKYETVSDYIMDCIGNGLHPLKSAPDHRWKVSYAFRGYRDEYHEGDMWVRAVDISAALDAANDKLRSDSDDNDWSAWKIYDIGIMADADEEIV